MAIAFIHKWMQNWPEVDMDEDNNETVVNEDYADLQDNTGGRLFINRAPSF